MFSANCLSKQTKRYALKHPSIKQHRSEKGYLRTLKIESETSESLSVKQKNTDGLPCGQE